MQKIIGSFNVNIDKDGIALVVFSRPPVNSVSISVYEDIGNLTDFIGSDPHIRVAIITALDNARAWCGGADLNDFVGMDTAKRKERYRFINTQVPRFYQLDKPVIAAINSHAIGIGMVLAGLCDMRVAAEDACFAVPEINYGLVGGGAGLFSMLNMPEAKIREMLFTGRKYTARELEPTGFFNYVVAKDKVLDTAFEIARLIAKKSLPAIRARKTASVNLEGKSWMEAYLEAQALSADLVASTDAEEGVQAFLDNRTPDYSDK